MQHASEDTYKAGSQHRPAVDCLQQNSSVTFLKCRELKQRTHDTLHTFSSQYAPAVNIRYNMIDRSEIE